MKIGFIGLGAMGTGIARSLLGTGHEVTVHNRTRSRADALAPDGAEVAATVAGACGGPVVMTMLADDAAVEATVFGHGGILGALPPAGTHVSLSTISTALSRRLADAHARQGQGYVAAPVFGRPEAAAARKLVVVAAGPADAVALVREPLEAIGRKLFVLGPDAAAANALKLAGNFLLVSMIESLGEAFAMLRPAGVAPAQFLEIVNGSLVQSPIYESYGRIIAERRFEPAGFKLRLGLKDVRLVLAAAGEADVPMPVAELLRAELEACVDAGLGDADWSALAGRGTVRAGR